MWAGAPYPDIHGKVVKGRHEFFITDDEVLKKVPVKEKTRTTRKDLKKEGQFFFALLRALRGKNSFHLFFFILPFIVAIVICL